MLYPSNDNTHWTESCQRVYACDIMFYMLCEVSNSNFVWKLHFIFLSIAYDISTTKMDYWLGFSNFLLLFSYYKVILNKVNFLVPLKKLTFKCDIYYYWIGYYSVFIPTGLHVNVFVYWKYLHIRLWHITFEKFSSFLHWEYTL